MAERQRVLVVGFGSIGRRHLANVQARGLEVAVLRRPGSEGDAAGFEVVTSYADAERWGPTAVIVATPTSLHADAARWALEHGLHVLVEKPLTADPVDARELEELAERAGTCAAVAYNLRFHPALEAVAAAIANGRIGRLLTVSAEVGRYLPDWHPGEDYSTGYAARADLGGGALLTLSHELDYVCWIAGEPVWSDGARFAVSELELDVDDLAFVCCRHRSGAVSLVRMDYLDRSFNRRSRWIGETATIETSWGGPVQLLAGDATETLWDDPTSELADTYVATLDDFLAAAASGRPPRTSFAEARRLVEVCAGAELRA
jgi:predicted dehydrogenase